jgi:hypothetical protein
MDHIVEKYTSLCNGIGDINEHLPTLSKYASECESVIEMGVRGCVSSWAFLYGLLQNGNPNRRILLNDISPCDINELLMTTKDLEIKVDYQWVNDLDLETSETFDLTFIDTWHVYGQLKRELAKYAPITNKYIIMHDTTVDEIEGETIRLHEDPRPKIIETGWPVDDVICGLGRAIDEFLKENESEWVLHEKYTNNNGLTILRRIVPFT